MVALDVANADHGFLDLDAVEALLAKLRASLHLQRGADDELEMRERRALGVFFTPRPLVEFVTRVVISARGVSTEPIWGDGYPQVTALDPAAGDGRFIEAVAKKLVDLGPPQLAESTRWQRAQAACTAIERNPMMAALIEKRLPHCRVIRADAVLEAPAVHDIGNIDIIVGNPPYLRATRMSQTDPSLREALKGQLASTSRGEWDLYAAFIERAAQWLSQDGVAGLVVPSRWLTSKAASGLRETLATNRAVRALVDFGTERVFRSATTYASTVFIAGARWQALGDFDLEVVRVREGVTSAGRVPSAKLGSSPWPLAVGDGAVALDSMRSKRRGGDRRKLGELATIAKGSGTNADGVFVLSDTETLANSSLVRPCIRGRDVSELGTSCQMGRLLYPYDEATRLIEPAELESCYPDEAAYLNRHRDRLEAREGGRFRGDAYYQFGRPQNRGLWQRPGGAIVIPDVVSQPRAMRRPNRSVVLDSAYVITPNDPSLTDLILAIFNSSAVLLFLRETGLLLRGGYVRMKTAYLRELPIPDPESAGAMRAAGVARAAETGESELEELSSAVRAAYGVGAASWPAISPRGSRRGSTRQDQRARRRLR